MRLNDRLLPAIRRYLVLLALVTSGCSSDEARPSAKPGHDAVRPPEEQSSESLRVLSVSAWPGRGLQLTASVGGAALDASKLHLVREDGQLLPLEFAPVSESAGITGIVIVPAADPALHAARLEAARALLDALPPAERVGVWSGSGPLPMIAELSARRAHVRARLSSLEPLEPDPLDNDALQRLAARLTHVSAPLGPVVRTLAIVGEDAASVDPPPLTQNRIGVAVARLGEARRSTDGAAPLAKYWGRTSTPEAAGAALAEDIAELRGQFVRVGTCSDVTDAEILTLEYGDARATFEAPTMSTELADVACDAGAASRNEYPLGENVALELTADQLALHDQYDANQDETEFTLSIRLGDAAPVAARAHFRGQTSLKCGRKSYSVHFVDDVARRIGPNAFGSEFYLLSLCKDPGEFRQVLANRLMAKLDLFPLEQRYVRLTVAGRERGVYLLLEKPDEHLKRSQAAVSAVIRRRFDSQGEPDEVKYPKPERAPDEAASVLDSYHAVLEPITGADPAELFDALSGRLDLDNYLRWLAVQSTLQCGDYVDETFFYASVEGSAPYFRNLGWDTDDLFEQCHHDGRYALRDAHELVYCAEGKLDTALTASSDVYHRYAETLAGLLRAELAPEQIESELDEVHDDLLGRLVDDAVCVGTGEALDGQPATCDRLRPWIEEEIATFRSAVRARAAFLREHLALYGVEP